MHRTLTALTASAAILAGTIATAAPAAAKTYNDQMVTWNDCRTFERYGPFWGRVALGGNNPAKFPPCGPRPVDESRAKYVGPAFKR